MSKKIAQLTKVIYHLNTKNEDHSVEMEMLSANHQAEIQNILRDAANRISKFKEMVENRQQSINQEVKVEKLVKKHEAERAAAQAELQAFKARQGEREQKLTADYQTKYEALRKEVEAVGKRFAERLQALDGGDRRHEQELAELVRAGNERYQAMLVEQLAHAEALKRDLTAKAEAALREQRAKAEAELREQVQRMQAEADKELGQTRARMAAEKAEAVLALKHEAEQKAAEAKAEHDQRMERLLADLRAKAEALDALKASSAASIQALEDSLRALRLTVSQEVGGAAARAEGIAAELAAAQAELRATAAKVIARDEQIAAMQARLTEKSAALAKAEADVAALSKACEQAKAAQVELAAQLTTSQKETASLREEFNHTAMLLLTAREDLKKGAAALSRAETEAEGRINKLQAELEELRALAKDLKAAAAGANQAAGAELQALRARADRADEARATAEAEHSAAMAALRARLQAEADALSARMSAAADSALAREEALRAEAASRIREHAEQINALSLEHMQRMDAAVATYTAEAEALRGAVSEAELAMQACAEQAEQDKAALRNELAKLDSKHKALVKEMEARRKEGERAESMTAGLKNQIEALRDELKSAQRAFREKMDISTAKLEADWAARLEAELARAAEDKATSLEVLRTAQATETAALLAAHDEEVRTLKLLLQKEAGDSALQLSRAERAREQAEAALLAEKAARTSQVAELTEHYTSAARTSEEAHRSEVERVRRECKSQAEGREGSLLSAHEAELARWRSKVEEETVAAAERLAAALHSAAVEAEGVLRGALDEQARHLATERRTALDTQAAAHAAEVSGLQGQHDRERSSWEEKLRAKADALDAAQAELRGASATINAERTERQRREEAFSMERDKLLRVHTEDLRKEKESAERRLLEVMQRADGDIKILQAEHSSMRGKYEERMKELKREYQLLEDRWRNRESRPEDLQRIEQLTVESADKDEAVARAQAELATIKREMLNREENYNQKFGRSVNVGVMQVVKPKDEAPPVPVGPMGKAKPTAMRVIPQAGSGAMGMGGMGVGGGMGMGMGIGIGSAGSSKGNGSSAGNPVQRTNSYK